MNEQIKQLWEDAAKTTQGDSWEEQTKFMERFADLIVRECADIATLNAHQWESPGSYVLEHFGLGKDEFKLGSLADADAFAKKRNYHYTNTDNPIYFPDEDSSNSR
jgi:hypothetical protein